MIIDRTFTVRATEFTEYRVHLMVDHERKGGHVRVTWRMLHKTGDQPWTEAPSLSGCNLSREGILTVAAFASQQIGSGSEVAANIENAFDAIDREYQ